MDHLCYGQHTDWRCVCFTYQTVLSPWSSCLRTGLRSIPQVNTLQHQKDNLRTSKQRVCGPSVSVKFDRLGWQKKYIHLSQPSQVLLKMFIIVNHTSDLPAVISPSQPTSLAIFLCSSSTSSSFTNASIVYENKQIAQRQYMISQYLREKLAGTKTIIVHHDAFSNLGHLYR